MIKSITVSVLTILLFSAVSAFSISIDMGISGPGAVNDSTIKAGEKVFFDVYITNDANFRGFSIGFKFTSPDITSVIHPSDKGNGSNKNGDVKAYNGWNDLSVWDFSGFLTVESDWDGKLPELVGFGGVSKNKGFNPQSRKKNISIEMILNQPGTITVDSAFFPPSGKWLFTPPSTEPKWGGPYHFNVIK